MHFHLEKANSAHGFLSLRSSGDNLQPDGWVFWSSFERADFVMSDTLQLWNRHFHIYPILQYQMAHQSPNDANSGRIRQSFRVLLHQIRKGLQSPSLQECNFSIDEIILRPKVSSVSGPTGNSMLALKQLADTQPSASYNCFSEICQQG